MGMRTPLKGQLFADIKVEESTWYVQDSLLSIQLLKAQPQGPLRQRQRQRRDLLEVGRATRHQLLG